MEGAVCRAWGRRGDDEVVVARGGGCRLTLVLLNGMVYSEDELSALEDELDSVPDRPQDLDPAMTHVASKKAVPDQGQASPTRQDTAGPRVWLGNPKFGNPFVWLGTPNRTLGRFAECVRGMVGRAAGCTGRASRRWLNEPAVRLKATTQC